MSWSRGPLCNVYGYFVSSNDMSAGSISFTASAASSVAAVPGDLTFTSTLVPTPEAAVIGDPDHVQVRADANGNMAVFWHGVAQFYRWRNLPITDLETNNGFGADIGTNWIVNPGSALPRSLATRYLRTTAYSSYNIVGGVDAENKFGTLGAGTLSKPNADSIKISWTKNGLTLAQTITVSAADPDAFHMRWSLTNNTASVNSARVIWGGDTAFSGNDWGFSSINAARTVLTSWPSDFSVAPWLVTLTGNSAFNGFEGGEVGCVRWNGGGALGNLNPSFVTSDGLDQRECGMYGEKPNGSVDLGNAVQYDTGTVAVGSTWTKGATMRFASVSGTTVTDAPSTLGAAGQTVSMTFNVVNGSDADLTNATLALSGLPSGWSAVIDPSNLSLGTLPIGAVVPVTVKITIPSTASQDSVATLALSLLADGIDPVVGTGTLTVGPPLPAVTPGTVSVAGTPKVGETLSAVIGTPSPADATPSYLWTLPNGTVLGTGSSLVVPPSAQGLPIKLTVTWAADEHIDASVSATTGKVAGKTIAIELPSVGVNGVQTVNATGFVEGETVTAVMYSTPLTIGTKTVGQSGAVSFSWKIPAGTAPGVHTVTLTGSVSGPLSVQFLVTDSSSELSNTGFDAVPTLAVAALTLGSGVLLLLLSARRRRG